MVANTESVPPLGFSYYVCYGVEYDPKSTLDIDEVIELYSAGGWDYSNPLHKDDLEWALRYADYSIGVRGNNSMLVGIGSLRLYCERYILDNLLVHPDYRKQGIGTFIVNKRVAYAEQKKWDIYIPELLDTNTLSTLYKKLGFVAMDGELMLSCSSDSNDRDNTP